MGVSITPNFTYPGLIEIMIRHTKDKLVQKKNNNKNAKHKENINWVIFWILHTEVFPNYRRCEYMCAILAKYYTFPHPIILCNVDQTQKQS